VSRRVESRESRVESEGFDLPHLRPNTRDYRFPLLCLAGLLLIVGLRLVALRSDPYTRLDWSGGQLTDEGFYIHNARNVALFGHARTDEFNNMLLAPLLHYLQVAVFTVFGVGSIQARMISVVCSLVALWLLWAALRRVFDNRVALTAVVFLGLDHTSLLFNRMALMDTPAMMCAAGAFYAFVRGTVHGQNRKWFWLVLCGLLLGVTVTNRMLCAYLLPVPLIALWAKRRMEDQGPGTGDQKAISVLRPWSPVLAVLAGLAVALTLYVGLWYGPYAAEIAPMSRYYRVQQVQPKSLVALGRNVYHALLGDYRGFAPYLFRHTPVLFFLALVGIAGSFRSERPRLYLALWLLLGWVTLAAISYSPSRYYVTTYPALAALASLGLWRSRGVWAQLVGKGTKPRLLRGALVWFFVYHLVEAITHRAGVLPIPVTNLFLYGTPSLAAWAAFAWPGSAAEAMAKPVRRKLAGAALAAWCLVNAGWLADWVLHLDYSQHRTSRWLAATLPPGSVVIGDVAPGLCLDNDFVAVHVQAGLCNWRYPIEDFAGRIRFIARLDGRWRPLYWNKFYPELVDVGHRLTYTRVLRWDVGVYSVDIPVERLRKK
jgi:4-amino-4-deoxy-L-arabinose transferase-like glycosyltransferase